MGIEVINYQTLLNDFRAFISNPRWFTGVRGLDFDTLSLYFSLAILEKRYSIVVGILIALPNKSLQHQLLLADNGFNLLLAIQSNEIDMIDAIFDVLDDDDTAELEAILVSSAEIWIPSITKKDTLIPLLTAMSLPSLLKISKTLHRIDFEPYKPWLYAQFTQTLCENLSQVLILPKNQESQLKALIDSKLEQYIASIENNQRRPFRFFKNRQTENRQINYELAQKLREELLTKPTAEVFENIYTLRDKIRQGRPNAPWFNSIRSEALNEVIHLAHPSRN